MEAYDFRKTKYVQMTSPYYNNIRVNNSVVNKPIPHDACDECGTVNKPNNPVVGAKFGNEILFQCQECSLNEIYTELDKENG